MNIELSNSYTFINPKFRKEISLETCHVSYYNNEFEYSYNVRKFEIDFIVDA